MNPSRYGMWAAVGICVALSGCGSSNDNGSSSGSSGVPGLPGNIASTLTKLSFDPYTNANAQHETATETNIVSHGNTLVAGFHIARLIGGGVTNIGWAVSSDGGKSWQHAALSGTSTLVGGSMTELTDPVVAYDAKHSVWMISYIGLGGPQNAAFTSLSRDDGRSFGPPVVIATGNTPDKNWTGCDNFPGSPHYGTCYTEYDEDSDGKVFFSRSTDGGASWEATPSPADGFSGISGVPVVLPTGRVVVPIADTSFTHVYVITSDDGGASWSTAREISDIQTSPARAGLRAEPNLSATVDASGKVYLSWYDCRFESGCGANGLVLSTSTDGSSWSAPARISTFPVTENLDHLFPGIGADPGLAGKLGLVFYTVSGGACVGDDTQCEINAKYSSSRDGGATWSAPVQLAGPMRPEWVSTTARGKMLGDYTGVAFAGGIGFPTFSLALAPAGLPYNQGIYTFPQAP